MTTTRADNGPRPAAVASSDTRITVAAGQTATIRAAVSGGAITRIETETIFTPELVIDYHPGPNARYDNNIDPRYILTNRDNEYWSLGHRGWIVLGFPKGIRAGRDFRLRLAEDLTDKEFVDFYIAQTIDNDHPALHDSDHLINGAFDGNTSTFREATPKQTRPQDGVYWPSWVPQTDWLYLGYAQGQTTGATRLTLANIPYGTYYYLLLHDRRFGAPSTPAGPDVIVHDGADIRSATVVYDNNIPNIRLILVIDNSSSAASVISIYKKNVRDIINDLPIGGRQAWISVRFIEDLGSDRLVRAEELIKTRRHSFAKVNGSDVHWKQVTHDNKEETIANICDRITMDKPTSPILSALLAVEKEEFAEIKKQLDRPSSSTTEIRMILITDGLPDPYNRYQTPADLNADDIANVRNSLKGNIKKKLEDFNVYLQPKDRQLIGHYEPNGTWLQDLWRDELGGVISVLSSKAAVTAPANMHAIKHTDCLNGSREIGNRIGVNEPRRAAHQPPPPYETIPKAWQR